MLPPARAAEIVFASNCTKVCDQENSARDERRKRVVVSPIKRDAATEDGREPWHSETRTRTHVEYRSLLPDSLSTRPASVHRRTGGRPDGIPRSLYPRMAFSRHPFYLPAADDDARGAQGAK